MATNLITFADEAVKIRDDGVLTLSNSIKNIEAIIDVQNNSILDNSAQLTQIQTDVSVVQNEIQSQRAAIEKLEGNHGFGNETVNDISSRIAILEFKQTVNEYIFSNQTGINQLLEKDLNDQNSSIQRLDEKVLQLESQHKRDRTTVKELKATVRLIEENVTVTADEINLQNTTAHLNKLDRDMTLVNEMIQIQQNNHELLKENMTAYKIESFDFNQHVNALEARINTSETSLVDQDYRIGQVELRVLSEFTLNEDQKTQIYDLEEEMNKTWIAMQGFGEVLTDLTGKR